MHNSQDNLPMRYDSGSTPLAQLLRGDCYSCHAQGVNSALYSIGIDVIPQVYHSEGADLNTDLAGGNFAYIDGFKGGAASDAKGHNIEDLWAVGPDATLNSPPGGIIDGAFGDHPGFLINSTGANALRCAGTKGCHGNRISYEAGYDGINGAHHDNVNGQVIQGGADKEPGHGYRFLLGVNGYEDTDWQYTRSATDHNEYYGRATPTQLDCSASLCHPGGVGGVRPPNGTMAEYCGTCHGNFHTLAVGSSDGVGPAAASPFIRHPSDLSIPNAGEYAGFVTYLTVTPVARLAVPAAPAGNVTPGSDAVFCLSCHVAHGSPYPDMLKWDYATMQVGSGIARTGCFACHRAK